MGDDSSIKHVSMDGHGLESDRWTRMENLCIRSQPRVRSVSEPSVVQSLSCFRFFETPWTAALGCSASLSFTLSRSLLQLVFIESVMPFSLSSSVIPSPPSLNLSQHQSLFQ